MTKMDIIRKKQILEFWMGLSIVLIVLSFILFIPVAITVGPIFMIGFILFGFMSVVISSKFKKLSIQFKEVYVREMLKSTLEDAYYEPKEGFTKEFIYNSKIVKKEDRFHSEDLIKGELNGYRFRCADIHLEDVRSNGKSTSVVTVFRGRFFEFETEKKIDTAIYVTKNNTYFFPGNDLKRIELEWVDFNQSFDVFSEDEQEAFLLLKPRFMEKLMVLKQVYKDIRFAFLDQHVYIAINDKKDNFDLKMFKPIDDSFLKSIEDDLNNIKELLETIQE